MTPAASNVYSLGATGNIRLRRGRRVFIVDVLKTCNPAGVGGAMTPEASNIYSLGATGNIRPRRSRRSFIDDDL